VDNLQLVPVSRRVEHDGGGGDVAQASHGMKLCPTGGDSGLRQVRREGRVQALIVAGM